MTEQAVPSRRAVRRPWLRLAAVVCATLLWGAACGGRSNDARVFDESQLGTQGLDGRAYALRLTVFEYAQDTGGFVEWFALDGDVNTVESPYFVPTHCAYFGQGPLDDREFRIDTAGPEGERLLLQVTRDSRSELQARVVASGGAFPEPPTAPLSFVDSGREPARSCRPR